MARNQDSVVVTKSKFPQISRMIPAGRILFLQLLVAGCLVLVAGNLFYAGQKIQRQYEIKKQETSERQKVENEYHTWKGIIAAHPDFRDAYIQASLLALTLGETSEAKQLLEQARTLDPNFTPLKRLRESL